MSGLFSSIASGVGNFFSNPLVQDIGGRLISGGLSYLGADKTIQAAQEAALAQAQGLRDVANITAAGGNPYSVGSLGGTAEFDPETKSALLNLSPELSNIYSGLLSRSGMFGSQAGLYSSLDPFAAGDLFYQQQQALVAPEEERMRTDLETRLLSQGRLGTTGGGRNIEDLERGLATARDARRVASFNQAQNLIDALLGRESADIEAATSLLDVPLQQGKLGMGIGGTVGAGVSAASKARSDAVRGINNAFATSPLGTALSYGAGLFGQPKKEKT
tara:strand:+ start:988 stop:1812 length:825 start_codon:yes stop_codon:yes gene_type:complete